MKKITKLLHKKLDQNIEKNKAYKKRVQQMDALFKEESITFDEKDILVYFKKEITYRGILNKRAIENAYLEGYTKMHDYFDTLDYVEKQRLMHMEIQFVCANLTHFVYEGQAIYIPFFDVKLNSIYEKETVLFSLKQYRSLFSKYQEQMNTFNYGMHVYQSTFSSVYFVYGYANQYAIYSQELSRLYIIEEEKGVDFISVAQMSEEYMVSICEAYFNQDRETFINELLASGNIDEKLAEKLHKKK